MKKLTVTGAPGVPATEIRAVRKAAKAYIRLLEMRHWRINIRVVRAYEMPEAIGWCGSTETQPAATIRLLTTVDMAPGGQPWERDIEATLVHELLHALLGIELVPNTSTWLAVEQGINVLADALVALRRGRDE